VQVRWVGTGGSKYQVQYRAQLDAGDWVNLGTPIEAVANGEQLFEESLTEAIRFYRVVDVTE